MKSTKEYFFDTDCLSTFIRADADFIIFTLYKYVIIPRPVYKELSAYLKNGQPVLKNRVDQLVQEGKVRVHDFYFDMSDETLMFQELSSYNEMNIPIIGKGEAACIALAYTKKGVLASNNLKDVTYYIEKYKLEAITTADILVEPYNCQIIDWRLAEEIWKKISRFSKLPTTSFLEYFQQNKINLIPT